MKLTGDITFFERITSGNSTSWKKHYIRRAFVTVKESANSNISVRGFVPNSSVVVRFAPRKDFSPKPGDRIFIGSAAGEFPPAGCRSVLSVSGGDKGSRTIRLIKAVCG